MNTEQKIDALMAIRNHLQEEIESIIDSNSMPIGDRSTLRPADEEWVQSIEAHRNNLDTIISQML